MRVDYHWADADLKSLSNRFIVCVFKRTFLTISRTRVWPARYLNDLFPEN